MRGGGGGKGGGGGSSEAFLGEVDGAVVRFAAGVEQGVEVGEELW